MRFWEDPTANGQLELMDEPRAGSQRGEYLYLGCRDNTLLTLYVVIGKWLEERKLVLEFGEAYLRYQRQVPMLIPFAMSKRN